MVVSIYVSCVSIMVVHVSVSCVGILIVRWNMRDWYFCILC